MENIAADFIIEFNNPIEAEYELAEGGFDCSFELFATATFWGGISGTLSNQTDLQAALDLKADKTELNTAVSELNTNIQNEATMRAENDTLLQNNINTLSQTVTANYNTLDGKISDNSDDITSIQNTIDAYGDIVTYNAANFATSAQGTLADTALQPNDNISELVNNVGYITSSSLPIVNNATLTIQKNSTDIDTFTANASVDKIINIPVPVNASDVNALPDITKYGASIDVALNTTDYKLTISLKDQDGTVLNSKVVDFPIESVVVNGSYDNVNQKIILTLQNGNTIEIPVGGLIAGLQTEITSTNKLDADLVDDSTSTNKFVTTGDKTTWNGKQDAISDLATIRSNATNGQSAYTTISGYGNIVTHNVSEFATSAQGALADSALQPNDNISKLTNDVGYITSASLPTVNNGTLTIQANGTTVGTFTANQAGNTTANIVVPDSATWGNITGTLSNQTDLQTALDLKADKTNIINGIPLSTSSGYFYGTSSSAATDVEKTVSIPSITELNAGQVIIVQPSVTSTVANSTLKLNNFDAYPMRYSNAAISTSVDSTVWNAAFPTTWVFDGEHWVFVAHGIDTNTTYTINYSLDGNSYISGVGTYAITRYSLIMQKPDMTWEKITATDKTYSTATTKDVNTNGFIFNQIRYYGTTGTKGNGALVGANVVYQKSSKFYLAYSANCGTAPGWDIGDYIYLVGTIGADGLFYLDTTQWWSNALPSTNDGKLYIRIGVALTTTDSTATFLDDRPVFYHNGTKICEYKVADNKQDLIPDLATIRSGASAGATALQPNDNISELVNNAGFITASALTGYEQTSNKVTSISSSSTDTQYPSAKCVYDIVGDIETLLQGV